MKNTALFNHRKGKSLLFFGLVFSFSLVLTSFSTNLRAQANDPPPLIRCVSGVVCGLLEQLAPKVFDNLNELGTSLQEQYIPKLAEGFRNAHGISIVSIIPYTGSRSLNYFTVGTNLNASLNLGSSIGFDALPGGERNEEENLPVDGLSIGGITATGTIYGGLNLGRVLSLFGLDIFLLDRVDLFYGMFVFDINQNDFLGLDSFRYEIDNHLVGVNVQLLKSFDLFGSKIIRWQGISSKLWYVSSLSNLRIEEEDGSLFKEFTIDGHGWKANNILKMKNKLSTFVVEFSTGLQLLYFLNFTAGAGLSWQTGESSIQLQRKGPLVLTGVPVGSLIELEANLYDNAIIDNKFLFYQKVGLEIHLPFIRIGTLGTFNFGKRLYSVTLNARVDI